MFESFLVWIRSLISPSWVIKCTRIFCRKTAMVLLNNKWENQEVHIFLKKVNVTRIRDIFWYVHLPVLTIITWLSSSHLKNSLRIRRALCSIIVNQLVWIVSFTRSALHLNGRLFFFCFFMSLYSSGFIVNTFSLVCTSVLWFSAECWFLAAQETLVNHLVPNGTVSPWELCICSLDCFV